VKTERLLSILGLVVKVVIIVLATNAGSAVFIYQNF